MPTSDPTLSRFFNRELSWLEFNQRVLEHAESAEQPLLERAKFLAITGSNLDEFFMVRVGGLKMQYERNPMVRDPAGLTIGEQLHAVSERCHHLQGHQYRILREWLEPALADSGIRRMQLETAGQRARAAADEWFQKEVLAVLSPQSLYYDLPFPMLQGLQLHLCVRLVELPDPRLIGGGQASRETLAPDSHSVLETINAERATTDLSPAGFPAVETATPDSTTAADPPSADPPSAGLPGGDQPLAAAAGGELTGKPPGWQFAVIPLGRVINRLITLPTEKGYGFVLLEDLVKEHIDEFFPGRKVLDCTTFRITRNADVQLREDAAPDLMIGMEEVLESRRQSRCVRLEISSDASEETVAYLTETLGVTSQDLFLVDGPLDLTYLFQLVSLEGFRSLRSEPWPPQGSPVIEPAESMFSNIARGDCLLIHPYERFDPVIRLIEEAAIDPDVLAIKQILYRTSRDSPIVEALKRAAEHGKYVTAIVELKARFDEARNIEWAREMERAGVQVIYGVRGLKTHAKVCIIVRREPHGIVRYMHFGTGNYNEVTASIYSDVSLLTSNEAIGEDATKFFNSVTGASQPNAMQHLAAAPTTMRSRLLGLIEAETLRRRQGQEAEIIAKVNAIVDTDIINALYEASQAGVRVRLNVRGVCCLVPGVKGLSKTIEVVSIVDRFLEHARVVYFKHGGDEQLFISSADWMPRNLDRRVELLVPILRPELRKRLLTTLQTYFKDNTNAWRLLPSGRYERMMPSQKKPAVRSQAVLYNRAVAAKRRAEQSGRTTFETHQPRQAD